MSCCGSRRRVIDVRPLPRATATRPVPAPAAGGMSARESAPAVAFVYVGATRLVAEGGATRRRYRFDHPGALVEVDARDAPGFVAIPQLRRRG